MRKTSSGTWIQQSLLHLSISSPFKKSKKCANHNHRYSFIDHIDWIQKSILQDSTYLKPALNLNSLFPSSYPLYYLPSSFLSFLTHPNEWESLSFGERVFWIAGVQLTSPPLVENEVRHNIQKHTMPQENKAVKAIQATTLWMPSYWINSPLQAYACIQPATL